MRKRMVTRTVKEQVVHYHVYNLKTKKVEEKETVITPPKTKTMQITKHLEKGLEENLKMLEIVATKIEEKRYGVPEEDFLKIATILPEKEDGEGADE